MRRARRPSPLTGVYAPAEWRERAFLRGRRIKLVTAFAWRRVRDLAQIEIALPNAPRFYPYREIDDFGAMKYHAKGPGTMSRRELLDAGMTDAQLEARVRRLFGVHIALRGPDTPKRRCLRFEAYALVIDALTSNRVEEQQKKGRKQT